MQESSFNGDNISPRTQFRRTAQQTTQTSCFHLLTMNPHLQISSDPADQVGGWPLLAALSRHGLVGAHLQQEHLIQHHLPQLWGELGNKLQAGCEELPRMSEILRDKRVVCAFHSCRLVKKGLELEQSQ